MVTIRTLVVADEESKFIWDYFDRSAFRGVELILACGDLKTNYLTFLNTMVGAPLLYVRGNHDTSMITAPPGGCDSLETSMRCVKGVRFLGFGGCQAQSPKPLCYTEAEAARQVSRRLQEISFHGGFDVLVTHAPAQGLGDGDDNFHRGFYAYRVLLDMFAPGYHFHGHQHLNYGGGCKRVIRYNQTQVYNACGYSVMDLEFEIPERPKRLSYLKTRLEWGRAYGKKP